MFTRSRNSHGGGVALYISTDYYDTGTQNQLRISESFIETIGIETIIVNKKYIFICIYRPPNGHFNNFLNEISDIHSLIMDEKYYRICIFGDLNRPVEM